MKRYVLTACLIVAMGAYLTGCASLSLFSSTHYHYHSESDEDAKEVKKKLRELEHGKIN